MKSVMISIQPKWCELIGNGEKTIEVRKTVPKLEPPFKCYIYCTSGKSLNDVIMSSDRCHVFNEKVIGEFICDYITKARADTLKQAYAHNNPEETCLTDHELCEYATIGKPLYFWHILELKIYDTPRELGEFARRDGQSISRAFQSWGYACSKE